jgi:hypothetical protein
MINTLWVLRQMLGRVPAPNRQIQATGEGNGVVHYHNLLVLGRTKRMVVIQTELNPTMCLPAKLDNRQRLALEGVDKVEVPAQDIHTEVSALVHKGIEERTEFVGVAASRLVGTEPCAAMDIPGHN